MIKKLLNNKLLLNSNPSKSVISAAFVITVAGLASRILGLLRDRLLASTFGAGDTLDIYYAAFRVPDLIYNLLILGALSAAFIPVFTGLISQEKDEEAWSLSSNLLNLAIFFIIIISLLFFLFAPFIMNLITPGFPPEKMDKVIAFTRIMFLSPLFLGISGILGGILTSFKRFLIYSLAPIFYNLGIIFGVLVLVKMVGEIGLAWGVVLGAFFHMLTQYPAARHLGFRHHFREAKYFSDPNLRKVLTLMIPRTLGIAISQINLLVITIFASTLATGSLAIFNFAQNIQSVPLGLVGISFSIAVFPVLSAYAAKDDTKNFVESFSETFRQILFFVIPMSIFMLLLRAQIVRVVLGAGKFDWEDTTLTFQVLGIFMLSLFAQSVIPLLARAFYAMHNTKTPFYIALFSEAVNIIAVLLLLPRFQVLGLAMAFSLASIFQMLFLLFALRLKFENLDDKRILNSLFKVSLASFVAGIFIQFTKVIVSGVVNMDTFLGVFTQMAMASFIGIGVFSGICEIVRLEEYLIFKQSITKRLWRGKKEIVEDTSDVSGI